MTLATKNSRFAGRHQDQFPAHTFSVYTLLTQSEGVRDRPSTGAAAHGGVEISVHEDSVGTRGGIVQRGARTVSNPPLLVYTTQINSCVVPRSLMMATCSSMSAAPAEASCGGGNKDQV